MTTLIRSLAAALALFAASATHAQDLQPLDRIAAVVDEDVILASELDRAVANIRGQYATRQDQLPPPDILERQVLERLISMRLQTATAARNNVRISDQEVDQAVAAIAQQNSFTMDQLRQQLASDGMSLDDFRASLRDELMIQRMRQRFAQTRISVSDAEVDAALSAQVTGTQYHLAHILVALPEGATPEQIQTGQQKIDGIKGLLDRSEMEFSAAAVRYSDSPNALEGGDLGWRSAQEIPAAFTSAVTSVQPGEVIGPIRGPSGFQLLQVVDRRDAAEGAAAAGTVTQFQARHILIRSQNGDDAAAKASADTLRARIVGGADFADIARDSSEDTATKDSGGDLGWFTQDEFGPDFGSQVAAISDGDVSQPFRTQAGWHIVQRQATRQTAGDDSNRRAQAREAIGQRKLEDEWDRYVRELRGEAYVSVRVGNNRDPDIGG